MNLPFTVLGKLPCQPDYVRQGAGGVAVEALFDWMIRALEDGAMVPKSGAMNSLCFRADNRLVLGCLAPSRDSAGRAFPAAVVTQLASEPWLARHPHTLPIVAEDCWSTAGHSLERVLRQASIGEESPCASTATLASPEPARATYLRWIRQMTSLDWVELVFESNVELAALALAAFCQAVEPYRGVRDSNQGLTLKLPLGRVGGAAVCFWLDALNRSTDCPNGVPSFFWSHSGESGQLLLSLGAPSFSILTKMWQPEGGPQEVFDVAAPDEWGDWRPPGLSDWSALLQNTSTPLAELLKKIDPAPTELSTQEGWWHEDRN